mmetsp:Transcript_19740/g.31504  ORF Transcript_19740/g.31504 Transcript_19740/m.31504 type:complete len:141 (+) Transcript_19740:73-495(+)
MHGFPARQRTCICDTALLVRAHVLSRSGPPEGTLGIQQASSSVDPGRHPTQRSSSSSTNSSTALRVSVFFWTSVWCLMASAVLQLRSPLPQELSLSLNGFAFWESRVAAALEAATPLARRGSAATADTLVGPADKIRTRA